MGDALVPELLQQHEICIVLVISLRQVFVLQNRQVFSAATMVGLGFTLEPLRQDLYGCFLQKIGCMIKQKKIWKLDNSDDESPKNKWLYRFCQCLVCLPLGFICNCWSEEIRIEAKKK